MIFYHGTSHLDEILTKGFDIDAPRRSDPGDFGWGTYLTKSRPRARAYGKVLQVHVDPTKLAHIQDPYFLHAGERTRPVTDLEKLFYELAFPDGPSSMKTVQGPTDARVACAKIIREEFLSRGYSGITTSMDDCESVIFDHSAILRVSICK